ncbi:MAG TPA: helix-turn-helix transcriptional regulator [Pseudonocardiaceae bacterium]|jgi:transcriptional regulator with XRE-family HTH domain
MAREPEAITTLRRALGDRLATFRQAAELTQGQLAQAAICDRTTVAHIEKGRSRGDERFWQAADQACRADGSLLTGFHEFQAAKAEHEQVVRVRELADVRARVAQLQKRPGAPTPMPAVDQAGSYQASLDALRQVVLGRAVVATSHIPFNIATTQAATREAHRLYQSADYDGAADLLPTLLWQLDRLADTNDGSMNSVNLTQTMAAAYVAAAKLATKQADAGLAWVTADRALRQAQESGHHGLIGAAQYQVACALLRAGHEEDAEQLAVSTADDMTRRHMPPGGAAHRQETLSVRGALLLLSAILAARRGDRTQAQQHLQNAWQLAEQLSVDGNWLWTAFGPTNVAIHEVAVRLDLGDTKQAVQLGAAIDTDCLPKVLAGRRSQVHLDLARAAVQQEEDGLAVLHLLEGERVAAQVISRNAAARSLLSTLLGRERTGATPGLRALAARADVLR